MTPELPEVFKFKSILHTLNTHPHPNPEAQMSLHFVLRPAVLKHKVIENQKCTESPQNDLNHLTVKSTLYILNTHPEAQISLGFALRPAFSRFKVDENRKCTEWP